jgi:hypothetical protein
LIESIEHFADLGQLRLQFVDLWLPDEVAACLDLMREFALIAIPMQQEFKARLRQCYYQIRKLP